MLEQHTFFRDPVEGRSFYHLISVGSGMRPAPVIGDAEQDIRAVGDEGEGRGKNGNKEKDNSSKHN